MGGEHEYISDPKPFERIPFENLLDEKDLYVGYDIGESTDERLLLPCRNLIECLCDTTRTMPVGRYKLFRLIEDQDLRNLSYGNASGSSFFGVYRSFLVEYKGNTEFVSLSMSDYVTERKPDYIRTTLNVAIDDEKTAHHSLEMVLDENLSVVSDKCTFYHHGKIGIGNIGSGRLDELRQFVGERLPEIICGKRYNLGTLTNDRLWYMDDPEVVELIENLISYALIRDEYRDFVKKSRGKS